MSRWGPATIDYATQKYPRQKEHKASLLAKPSHLQAGREGHAVIHLFMRKEMKSMRKIPPAAILDRSAETRIPKYGVEFLE